MARHSKMTAVYEREENELSDFECDQTVIIRRKYLPFVARGNYREEPCEPKPSTVEWYPFVNSYYPYTEDVDAFARVNHLIASKPSFGSLTTINDCHQDARFEATYSQHHAQLHYLQSKPVSFLILGKPGIRQEKLGKMLSEYWNSVYLDPQILIRDEIEADTRAGSCIEFNLRGGRAIGMDIIFRLLEKRVKTESVRHRGFVLCGFPLVPNDQFQEDPVSSESAVFNVQDIFDDVVDAVHARLERHVVINVSHASKVDNEEEEEYEQEEVSTENKETPNEDLQSNLSKEVASVEEVSFQNSLREPDVGSTHGNICTGKEIGFDYEEQINLIFKQFDGQFLIIYVTCPNDDVMSKHANYRFNPYTNEMVDLQEQQLNKDMHTIYTKQGGKASQVPEDFFDPLSYEHEVSATTDLQQLVHVPRDFTANVASQLDRYHYGALPVIERHVLLHDPQYFLKVDGRSTPLRMFNIVKSRLRILPVQKVLLPERLNAPEKPTGAEDDHRGFDVGNATLEECFYEFRNRGTVGPLFKWCLSDWGYKCPVSMKEGGYKDGDPQYAVSFMNQMFFLSDGEAYSKFHRNPRPYLLPPYPKPSCRIFVIGPGCSGKTAISQCLAYLLDGEIISPDDARKQFIHRRENNFKEKITSAAIAKALGILESKQKAKWQEKEDQRQKEVNAWVKYTTALLEEYERKMPDADAASIDFNMLSSFPVQLAMHVSRSARDLDLSNKGFSEIADLLRQQAITCVDDHKECKKILGDREALMEYLPEDLKLKEFIFEHSMIFDDFVKEQVDLALKTADFDNVELTEAEMAEMFQCKIKEIEDNRAANGKNRGGWIVDGMPLDTDLFDLLSPHSMADDIFILEDDGPDFLMSRFIKNQHDNHFYDFRQFFNDMGKLDVAWRSGLPDDSISVDTLDHDTPTQEMVEKFRDQLSKYNTAVNGLGGYFNSSKVNVVFLTVTNKQIGSVLKEVIEHIDSEYREHAVKLSPEDRLEEVANMGEPTVQDEEMDGEEMEENKMDDDLFEQNRPYGDTYYYCPVTFHEHWVLWKGKEEFAVKFQNKIYLCCNETAMNNFLSNPMHYLLYHKPYPAFPPPRICIVGPKGSGKTTVAKALCSNYGLYYFNYLDLLRKAANIESDLSNYAFNFDEEGADNDIVSDYLAGHIVLPPEIATKILNRLWFEDPAKTIGFVLDDYPLRPSDVDCMEEHLFIPDVIIELTVEETNLKWRNVERLLTEWKSQMNMLHENEDNVNRMIHNEWADKRAARYQELFEERRERRYEEKMLQKSREREKSKVPKPERPYMEDLQEAEEDTDGSLDKSQVTFDSVAEQTDEAEINAILDEELPKPVFEDKFETMEEAMERFESEFEINYFPTAEFVRQIRESCEAEQIPWMTADANLTVDRVIAQVFRNSDSFSRRNKSCFERCYDISVEVAEKLLSNGYYFLSTYGRTCPVQYLERKVPLQMFYPLEAKFQIFPMIHRQYIYFLGGNKNRNKFKEDPLKYTNQACVNFPLIPLRVAVIGPPKCGKTSLSRRFTQDLGLKVISQGEASRYALEYLSQCRLSKEMETVLRKGWELTDQMVAGSVLAASFDPKCVTQGMVLDGFPNSEEEVRCLAEIGLVPHLVIDLQAERKIVYEFLSSEAPRNGLPVHSKRFMELLYERWLKTAQSFRQWFDREYQITAKLPVLSSKWGVWNEAYELSMAVFSEIMHYYKNIKSDWPLRLANMRVTPLEFLERSDVYKHYCPCCLHYHNILNTSGDPPDRTGVVQFRAHFYWICDNHMEEFLACPEAFLSPYNEHALPHDLPQRMQQTHKPVAIEGNGVCYVCYKRGAAFVEGDVRYTVTYADKSYVFDSHDCMRTFMTKPLQYANVVPTSNHSESYPLLHYRELPTLGLLEQYVARQIVKAVTRASIDRPFATGLDPKVSAAIGVGLHLKIHSPETPKQYVPLYVEAEKKLRERKQVLERHLKYMKGIRNPYLHYEEPLPPFVVPEPEKHSVSDLLVPSSFTETSTTESRDTLGSND